MKEDDFKDVQAWISLKQYESPGEEYFEHFLEDFHKHQRQELLQQSSPTTLRRTLYNALHDTFCAVRYKLQQPRWSLAACAATLTVLITGVSLSSLQKEDTALAQVDSTLSSTLPASLSMNQTSHSGVVSISSESSLDAMPHMQRLDFAAAPAPVKVRAQQVF